MNYRFFTNTLTPVSKKEPKIVRRKLAYLLIIVFLIFLKPSDVSAIGLPPVYKTRNINYNAKDINKKKLSTTKYLVSSREISNKHIINLNYLKFSLFLKNPKLTNDMKITLLKIRGGNYSDVFFICTLLIILTLMYCEDLPLCRFYPNEVPSLNRSIEPSSSPLYTRTFRPEYAQRLYITEKEKESLLLRVKSLQFLDFPGQEQFGLFSISKNITVVNKFSDAILSQTVIDQTITK